MITPEEMLDLSARCEEAEDAMQSALIEQAWLDVFIGYGGDLNTANWPLEAINRWGEFQHFIEARAFLDAAITLVPEGAPSTFVTDREQYLACVNGFTARSAAPALALTAAALRAHAAKGEGR